MIRKSTMLKLTWIVVAFARLCAADPRIGAWKLVSANSALDPPRVLSITPQGKERIKESLVFRKRRKGSELLASNPVFNLLGRGQARMFILGAAGSAPVVLREARIPDRSQ